MPLVCLKNRTDASWGVRFGGPSDVVVRGESGVESGSSAACVTRRPGKAGQGQAFSLTEEKLTQRITQNYDKMDISCAFLLGRFHSRAVWSTLNEPWFVSSDSPVCFGWCESKADQIINQKQEVEQNTAHHE